MFPPLLASGDEADALDAFFMVTGRPSNLLRGHNPRFAQLAFVAIPATDTMKKFYREATPASADYPWLDQGVNTVATMAILVTFDFQRDNCKDVAVIGKLIRDALKEDEWRKRSHPKSGEVSDLDMPIPGWERNACVVTQMQLPFAARQTGGHRCAIDQRCLKFPKGR